MADQTGPTPPRWRQRRRPRGAPSTQGPPSGTDANNQGTVVDHSPGSHVQAAHQGDAVTKPRGFQQKPKGGNAQPRNQNPRPNNAPVSTAPATVRRPGPVITDLTAQKSSQAASQEPIDMSKPMVGLSLQTVSSDGLGMLPGQRCEQDIVLAPWKLVTNYPSIYIHEEDREEVSPLRHVGYAFTPLLTTTRPERTSPIICRNSDRGTCKWQLRLIFSASF